MVESVIQASKLDVAGEYKQICSKFTQFVYSQASLSHYLTDLENPANHL